MNNNELDKLIKDKMKNTITPSKEFENKFNETIKEQKEKFKIKAEKPKKKLNTIKYLISVAAMVLIVFMLGNSITNPTTTTVAAISAIKPTKLSNNILENDSEFIIYTTNEKASIDSIRESIYVEPALDYDITKTENPNEYKLTFKQNLPSNIVLKLQYVKNKVTENSWAYQTSSKLNVNRTYPSNAESNVDEYTIIEVELSYANVDNFQEHVKIVPEVSGNWEHVGRIWRFMPNEKLSHEKYQVIIDKDLSYETESLEEDYIFEFKVGETKETYTYSSISLDKISTFKPDEQVKIYFQNYYQINTPISKVTVGEFKTEEDFIYYLKTEDYEKADNFTEKTFKQSKNSVDLSKNLKNGYYVAILTDENNNEIFNCPIQINKLSAYSVKTERDILVWVAEEDNLASDIEVDYKGNIQSTNKQGIVEFKDIAEGTETIEYLKVGNSSNRLIIGVYDYDLENYPVSYLYTDRPLYKNTDTIKIWGFVPKKLFYEEIEDEFYIELNEEGKQKVKLEEDGSINYTIELENHADSYAWISLYYKDSLIATRSLSIENYEAQNYHYNILTDKNYVYEGQNYEFDIEVNHITGIKVPNKPVNVKFDDVIYTEFTNENGIAHFIINIPYSNNRSSAPKYKEICIYNGDVNEYNTYNTYISFYQINSDVYTSIDYEQEEVYKEKLYKLQLEKDVEKVSYNLEELYDEPYDTEVEVLLETTSITKVIKGYVYDVYKNENVPEYDFVENKYTLPVKIVKTENGILEINKNELKFEEDTDEITYSYILIYKYKDQKGNEVEDTRHIYKDYEEAYVEGMAFSYNEIYCYDKLGYDDVDVNSYYSYRYFLKRNYEKFSIGEKFELPLSKTTENGVENIENEGKILRIIAKQNIINKEIIENNDLSYTFKEEDFPGCTMTTAYFYKGNFYRMPIYYFDFEEKDRKLDIEIEADKEQYKPGDEVTLTIKTKNNNKPIATTVNVSVVNEAVLKLSESYTDIEESLYSNNSQPIYTYSTYRDFLSGYTSGEGGGGGEPRANFGDTACFETVETNSHGVAKIKFKLPDNVTTYTTTVHGVNEDLYYGVDTFDITSTLDFFIQYTEPRGVKTTDDLVLNATSISEELQNIEYEFTIKELNKTLTTTAESNKQATVNFGKLPVGTYTINITGNTENEKDSVEYKINIIESAQEVKFKETVSITEETSIKPSKNPIVLEIYNKNMEQGLKYIDFIEKTLSNRLDTQIAYNEIIKIKNKYYNTTEQNYKIEIDEYIEDQYLKNLPASYQDLVLSALIANYTNEYYDKPYEIYNDYYDLFEIYLVAAAFDEPVLIDLLELKEEQDISNYDKLLIVLSLEFLGDYQNAKELYRNIHLDNEEMITYKSLTAIIETFIDKDSANKKINELIQENPGDEYLRFAILSYFQNNVEEIEKESEVTIKTAKIEETIKLNGMQVQTVTISDSDFNEIEFESNDSNLMVSYYYQTLLDNIAKENIQKDINIRIDGELKKGNIVTLFIDCENEFEGNIKIVLPNSLRLAKNYNNQYNEDTDYYLQNDKINYVTFFKKGECTSMEIPLLVSDEGEYKLESVVGIENELYHISNSIDLNIE